MNRSAPEVFEPERQVKALDQTGSTQLSIGCRKLTAAEPGRQLRRTTLLFSAIGCNRMQEENSGAQKNKDYHRTQSHRRTRHLRRVQVSGETQFGVWAAS